MAFSLPNNVLALLSSSVALTAVTLQFVVGMQAKASISAALSSIILSSTGKRLRNVVTAESKMRRNTCECCRLVRAERSISSTRLLFYVLTGVSLEDAASVTSFTNASRAKYVACTGLMIHMSHSQYVSSAAWYTLPAAGACNRTGLDNDREKRH